MILEVKVDAARPLALLRNGGKRMAYAVVKALNDTALQVQKGQREHVAASFTLRKPEFLFRQAAVIKGAERGSGFANVGAGRFEARIAVGQRPRLLLSGFESGEERRPFKGKHLGVPVTGGPARPTFSSGVTDAYRFQNLSLRRVTARGQQKRKRRTSVTIKPHLTGSGKVQWKGTQRTFLLPQTAKAPLGGVFQRVGPGRDDIRMVYSFQNPRRLDRRLKFVERGRQIANEHFQRNLLRQVNQTLAYQLGFRR